MSWIQVIPGVTLNNITPPNNSLQNSYFGNPTIELHDMYVLNTHTNFHVNWMLFILRLINLSFMHYFKLQKLKFKQFINDMIINI